MFTPSQVDVLRKDLAPSRVMVTQGQSYLAAWDVRAHLTRIFGYGGWDFTVRDLTEVETRMTGEIGGKGDDRPRWSSVYRCTGRLVIQANHAVIPGAVVYEDASVGDSTNQVTPGDAHDLALKSAVSGALKRCAVNLGTQFGLSLYNAGSTRDVVRVLVTDETDVETPEVLHDDDELVSP